MNYEKQKIKEEIYRLTWSSLESHLRYTYSPSSEGRKFHQKCVKDYVRMMELVKKL